MLLSHGFVHVRSLWSFCWMLYCAGLNQACDLFYNRARQGTCKNSLTLPQFSVFTKSRLVVVVLFISVSFLLLWIRVVRNICCGLLHLIVTSLFLVVAVCLIRMFYISCCSVLRCRLFYPWYLLSYNDLNERQFFVSYM